MINLILCKLPICPNSIIDLKLGFVVFVLGYTSKFFPIKKEIFGFLNVALAGLLNFP